MWELMSSYIGHDSRSIQRSIVNHVEYTLARTRFDFDDKGAYQATAYSVRDRLIEAWNDTQEFHTVSKQAIIFALSSDSMLHHIRNKIFNVQMTSSATRCPFFAKLDQSI